MKIQGRHSRRISSSGGKIVQDGKTDYVIVIPPSADKNVLTAAEELTELFKEATGITLKTVTDCSVNKYFSLGCTQLGADVDAAVSELGESGYKIESRGEGYVLKGDLGVIYAVYDLLGILLNYKTFSDKTVRINKNVTELNCKNISVCEIPDFRYRSPSHAYIKYNERLKNRLRMTDLEDVLGGEDGPYHNNFNFIPPSRFAASHPKWYSDDGSQMCYTAHGDESERELLITEAAEAIKRYITANPDMPYIAFNHQDNFEWCCCPACTALKNKYDGANSASAAIFLNRVRAKLQEWFCGSGASYDKGQKLVFFAYHGTNKPPVRYNEADGTFSVIDGETELKNVMPWFAETNADYTLPLYEGEVNRQVGINMRGWNALSGEMLFWTYGTNFENYLAPYYSFGGTQQTYKFALNNGAAMVFDECQINTAASTAWEELKGFLNAELGWNVNADTAALTQEFFNASYGGAANEMLKIFNEYLVLGAEQTKSGYSGWRSEFKDPIKKELWNKRQLERWERVMTEAAESERNAVIKRNIVLERVSVRYLLAEVFGSEYPPEQLLRLKKAAAADIAASGITMFNEKKEIGVLLNKWGV